MQASVDTENIPMPQPNKDSIKFRILCTRKEAGGLIGPNGDIIKRLQRDTWCKIHVDMPVTPTCEYRLVHVIGSHSTTRNTRFDGVPVSPAQVGLLRVFERMLEVDPPEEEGGSVVCRLVVEGVLVGAVMGEGGKRVNLICKQTKAYVKASRDGAVPPCVGPRDELIQITGGSQPVKKALVAVSQYLQDKASRFTRRETSLGVLHSSMNKTGHPQINNTVDRGVKVVLKLLCPHLAVGAVMGTNGRRVKALEEETGVFIDISAYEGGSHERIITVSAIENREVRYSFAQDAVVRVFDEIVSSEERDTVTGRLLIPSNQSDWLNACGVSVISAIQKATGATLQIMENSCGGVCGSTDEKVIQIDGAYACVQLALFQVSWRLRESVFDAILAKDNSPLLPHKLFNVPSEGSGSANATLSDKMNECRVFEEVDNSLPSKFPPPHVSYGHCLTISGRSSRDLRTAKGDLHQGSSHKSVIVTNTKLEIAVHGDVFGAVFDDDGSNLARLRLISGATVEVHDPCSGSEGKVIISGTRDQTLVAQSLLQAFVMAAE